MTQQAPMMPNDTGLFGKSIIVTGGGSDGEGIGNGRAAAILCARAGAKVAVVGRRLEPLQLTVDMITREGGTAVAITGDVTEPDSCKAIVQETVDRFGRLDGLDNNVGEGHRGTVVDIDIEDWRYYMKLNVESQVLMSKYAIPAMIETASGGSIVNIGSVSALRPKGSTVYSTSKGANMALTVAMAADHGRQGIRVNCVVIGPVYTPTVYENGMSDEQRQRRAEAGVLGIEGTGWDTGHMVRFLLSDQARYVTGQCIVVDGGVTVVGPSR